MQVQALTAKIKEMEDKQAAVAMSSMNSPPSKLVAAAAAAASAARAHAQSAHPELVVAAQAAAPSLAQSASAVQALAMPSAKADTQGGGSLTKGSGGGDEVIPIIIFACCRERYLERTLQTLFERLPKIEGKSFEVWVSQDGQHTGVQALVKNKFPQASLWPISCIFPFFLSGSSCVASVLLVYC